MKENKAQMRGIKYLWHNLEYIFGCGVFRHYVSCLIHTGVFSFCPEQSHWLDGGTGCDMLCHDGLYWFNWSHPE